MRSECTRCEAMADGAPIELSATPVGWSGRFSAMASPCEVLIDGGDEALAHELVALARGEARRIERKFSRYRDDSVIAAMLVAQGQPLQVDDETAQLLDFAASCHVLSGGLFDVTSGVLRVAWRFDGAATLPDPALVSELCRRVGFDRVRWQRPWLTLPVGMEIDLGGIGKEYAVDRVLALLMARTESPMLVNFGGDLAVSGPRRTGQAWRVGIEGPDDAATAGLVELSAGALATSGDAHRHLMQDGVRYGHILNPHTGWPVRDAPRSVTVAAATCVQAGTLATLALLQGARAPHWLRALEQPHWVLH